MAGVEPRIDAKIAVELVACVVHGSSLVLRGPSSLRFALLLALVAASVGACFDPKPEPPDGSVQFEGRDDGAGATGAGGAGGAGGCDATGSTNASGTGGAGGRGTTG